MATAKKYEVSLTSGVTHKVTAEDVQITDVGTKFLNGAGKAATVVAFFTSRSVESVVEVVA